MTGGSARASKVKEQAKVAGHSGATLAKARVRAKVTVTTVPHTFPRQTDWTLPGLKAFDPTQVPEL